jgi:hypothetical protein
MDINDISRHFKLKHTCIETAGIGDGVIIKFKTFYLKIYEDISGGIYDISKYMYNCSDPSKTWKIPHKHFKHFAKSFSEKYKYEKM